MEHNYEERRLINEANIAAKKAKELTQKAEALKAERLKANSYAVRSKILGTPEWEREAMLKQERQIQADRAAEEMFKHGIEELIKHISTQGSIYGLRVVRSSFEKDPFSFSYSLKLNVTPHK